MTVSVCNYAESIVHLPEHSSLLHNRIPVTVRFLLLQLLSDGSPHRTDPRRHVLEVVHPLMAQLGIIID